MIERIQLLRNIGQFDSVSPNALNFKKLTLLYAENGRGKTTLAAILRSAGSGDASSITDRHRLGAQHPPHVVLADQTGPVTFQNGAWARTLPDVVVFDDMFVAANVCSGVEIGSDHRQNLHELILGAHGVALNATLQSEVSAIEGHNRDLRALAEAVPAVARGALEVDAFCALQAQADIDALIEEAERALAAARAADAVRTRAVFAPLILPSFDIAGIEDILSRDLPGLEASAAARVQAHMVALGKDGESWTADGMTRIAGASAMGEHEICPFCAQDLRGSPLIAHYQAYFSDAYTDLKAAIVAAGKAVSAAHADDIPAAFERDVRVASETRGFWSTFAAVPAFHLDTAEISRAWKAAREGLLVSLRAKYAAPLEPAVLPAAVAAMVATYEDHRATVEQVSGSLQQANAAIELVKEQSASANVATLEADVRRLHPVKARQTPAVAAACQAYLTGKGVKAATEGRRAQARAALDTYRTTVFPAYEDAINRYLARFGAGFRLDSVKQANTRGGSSCTYNVLINTIAVPVTSATGPAFRNTLSAGDRNALALAFFFASLENDANIGRKIVVIDDPMTSLDEHRNRNTLNEMRRLFERVDQMIVLSHSKPFLCPLWLATTTNDRAAIKIDRVRTGQNEDASTLTAWNVHDDCISDHDHRHEEVSSYLQSAAGADERAVAEALRPILEAFIRVAYPAAFKPGDLLGKFVNTCQQRIGTQTQIMAADDVRELREIVEYANEFHHDTNIACKTVLINGTELAQWAGRTLAFARRN